MFSGYIDVSTSNNVNRSIFYWFVESLNEPRKDPVALWTNGGPGCSGLGGFFTEQGPFRPTADLTLYVNNKSWVNVANMLFIEAPAGVGFSFSDNESDYKTDDNKTAIDNYHLIQGWLEQFPNYESNEFYITSESYGGHYMPTLAQQIVLGNQAGGDPQINFKGFFVGNPYTDPIENQKGQYDTWYGHQLVSLPSWQRWRDECDDGEKSDSVRCAEARAQLTAEVGDKIDPYALDFPVCNSKVGGGGGVSPSATVVDERVWFMKHVIKDALKRPVPGIYAALVEQLEQSMMEPTRSRRRRRLEGSSAYYPCESNWNSEYLNRAEVQTAIHAKRTVWSMCSEKVDYSQESMKNPMEPTYRWLIENGDDLHITIVSGDDDSVCGTLGTQSWIWDMNYTVVGEDNWKVWKDSDGQTGGYVTKFKDAFNFVTVHSAGHMIPETQPSRSLEAFTAYLKGDI
eukprot:CAMPEP_0202709196 /NCGR_PEP_ID=MMETSP1385-20130828/21322_1 /ASSEMBLY_ACC=CAM_ASM_000861 /TAXON_ID=933848 /ORGANISM="Elphidium margaritaceum" /LENGTH=455 /DNA_ID=CAMNT_0049368383 /DNA_START=169 /DNA_END=1536 /DNA_ORIENTATION=+